MSGEFLPLIDVGLRTAAVMEEPGSVEPGRH